MVEKYSRMLYSKDVIIKTAYSFLDRCYVHLDADDKTYIIEMNYKDTANTNENELKHELDEEIIAQLARYTVSERTSEIRKLILGRAFSSSMIAEKKPIEEYEPEFISNAETILKDWFEENE